jgi:hypothetical protein
VNLRGYWGDLVGVFVSRREDKTRERREDEKREWRCALVASNVFFFPEIFVKWRFVFQIGMKNLKIALLYIKFPL